MNLDELIVNNELYDRDMRQVAWLPGMLTRPFKGRPPGCAINRRE
ncbi:hypothetical protein [Thiogranum longum]